MTPQSFEEFKLAIDDAQDYDTVCNLIFLSSMAQTLSQKEFFEISNYAENKIFQNFAYELELAEKNTFPFG